MAEDIPYTIDTLATEFGRDVALIKVALDVLIELKMILVTADNIYRVKGFVKHQNIKVKEKEEIISHNVKNNNSEISGTTDDSKEINTEQDKLVILEIKDNSKEKRKKKSERKDGLVTELAVDEIGEGPPLFFFSEGDMPPLQEGEKVIWGMSLG